MRARMGRASSLCRNARVTSGTMRATVSQSPSCRARRTVEALTVSPSFTLRGMDAAADTRFRKALGHDFIIASRDGTCRFLPHIASLDAEPLGNLYKNSKVQVGMTFYDRQIIFLKVAGERGTADNIGTAVMINDILKVGSPLFDEPLTDRIGKIAGIFTDHEKMEPIIFLTGLLHQITVSQGKGIGFITIAAMRPWGVFFSAR